MPSPILTGLGLNPLPGTPVVIISSWALTVAVDRAAGHLVFPDSGSSPFAPSCVAHRPRVNVGLGDGVAAVHVVCSPGASVVAGQVTGDRVPVPENAPSSKSVRTATRFSRASRSWWIRPAASNASSASMQTRRNPKKPKRSSTKQREGSAGFLFLARLAVLSSGSAHGLGKLWACAPATERNLKAFAPGVECL